MPRSRNRVQDFSCLIQHIQPESVCRYRHQRPAGLRAAEDSTLDGLHVAAQGTGGVDHVVDVTAVLADVLEGVQVTADIHVHVVMLEKHGVHAVLHVGALNLVLVSESVYGMV